MTQKITFLGPKREGRLGGWDRQVEVNGVQYTCAVRRGKRVRIPYKPRGPGAYGYWWHGSVYRLGENGGPILQARTIKSIGCKGLLIDAGVIKKKPVVITQQFAAGGYNSYSVDYRTSRGNDLGGLHRSLPEAREDASRIASAYKTTVEENLKDWRSA